MSSVLEPPKPAASRRRAARKPLSVAEAFKDFIGSNAGAGLPADAALRHKYYLNAALKKKHSR